jgi:uncharacterized protein YfaS (alpha-2-macroglobulin family)
VADPILIKLVKPVENFNLNDELPKDIIEVTPKIEGKTWLSSDRSLVFEPKEHLTSGKTYTFTLNLAKLYNNIKSKYESYAFEVATITPDFKISLNNLEFYDEDWAYRYADIETSDIAALKDVQNIASASQNGIGLSLDWTGNPESGTFFRFKIDSIKRYKNPTEVELRWDGSFMNADNKGETAFSISPKDVFEILNVTTQGVGNQRITVNFSQDLQQNQNLKGLVELDTDSDLNFEISKNNLFIYPKKQYVVQANLKLNKAIKSFRGKVLSSDFNEIILFQQEKPGLRLVSKGSVLPNSEKNPFYFEAVNLKAVDVRIIKIYEDNVLQHLQANSFNETNSYNLKNVGRVIARKTVPLVTKKIEDDGQWKAYALNLNSYFKADPGTIYQVDLSFRPELSLYTCGNADEKDYTFSTIEDDNEAIEREENYWNDNYYSWRNTVYNWRERDNPCHAAYYNEDRFLASNLMASDLGMMVKKTNSNDYNVVTSNLISAQPENKVNLTAYNFQMQKLTSATTNSEGIATFSLDEHVAFIVAKKNKDFAYIKLDNNNALSLSNFDVSGSEVQKGYKGFIYTERGVYRPGDTIYTSFVLNDLVNPLPEKYPIKLQLTDARGKLVYDETQVDGVNNMYAFSIPTAAEAPTGNWNIQVNIGAVRFNKTVKVAAVKPNRLKIELDFEEEVLSSKSPVEFTLNSNWLNGAKARGLETDIELTLSNNYNPFPKFKEYTFNDVTRDFYSQTLEFFKGKLDNDGKIKVTKPLEISKDIPGMLKLSFLTKVNENGGDFSINVTQKDYAPYDHFIGLKTPEITGRTYDTDTETLYQIVAVDKDGKPVANKSLKAFVYQLNWRWWWNRGNDRLSKYQNSTGISAYKSISVETDSRGKASFKLNIPEKDRGRFLIRVLDEDGKHAASEVVYYYKNWWTNTEGGLSDMLIFNTDKDAYNVGEDVTVNFPSGKGAKALISIENGSEILSQSWVDTQEGNTSYSFKLNEKHAPNAFVSISLLQPHSQTTNDRPIRLFGVVPVQVSNANSKLYPQIELPDKVRPETHYEVSVSEENNLPMTYTLAVVDEGLLDLTNFKVPDIHRHFNQKEALGVQTFDIFNDVIGAYAGSIENIFSIGGGGSLESSKNRKANRFKPVVSFIGPFELKAGEKATHKLYMPNYIGSVKVMLVASDVSKERYGSTEDVIPVKKPLMLLASVPRKLSPGEKLSIPLTVFAMEDQIKTVKLTSKSTSGIKGVGLQQKEISFTETGDQIVNFDFEVVSAATIEKLDFTAQSGKETASYSLEIDTYNPNPIVQKTENFQLNANENLSIDVNSFGTAGSNSAFVEISALPPIDLGRRIETLIGYPHGCVEQTTSKAFPQLYLEDIAELSFSQKKDIQQNISEAIRKLDNYQQPNGGLSYWPGGSVNDWCTTYVGHFMIEAQKKGYDIPIMFINNWKTYQKEKARRWNVNTYYRRSDYLQAYRLYSLALIGEPDLAAMNKLRNMDITNVTKWRLAQAYAIIGQKDVAIQLIDKASLTDLTYENGYYTYGSVFRNQAMLLESLVNLNDSRADKVAEQIALKLSSNDWLSTQETAYGLISMSKLLLKNGGKDLSISYNGEDISTSKPILSKTIELDANGNAQLNLINQKDSKLYVRLVKQGKPALGESVQERKNLSVKVSYMDANGNAQSITTLKQGSEVNAILSISNLSTTDLENVALQYHLASGLEIIDTSFTEMGTTHGGQADYVDTRDNEVRYYMSLDAQQTKTFKLKMNASYLGEYFMPGTQAETMYSNSYFARTKDVKVKIVE